MPKFTGHKDQQRITEDLSALLCVFFVFFALLKPPNKELFNLVMTRPQCSPELPTVAVSKLCVEAAIWKQQKLIVAVNDGCISYSK
jgi:hypothetical protein